MESIKIYAEVIEPEALNQFYTAMALPCNIQGALMPDTHTGYTLPIGAVIKSQGKIFPSYIGYDIGCGMCAIRLDVKCADLTTQMLESIRDLVVQTVPLGPNKHKSKQPASKLGFTLSEKANEIFESTAPYQIGTLGGGNHFIELGKDNEDYLNIVIHSGSRGVGFKIADYYMKQACIADVDPERYAREFDDNPKNKSWYNSKGCDVEKYEQTKQEFIYRRTRAKVKTNTEGHYGFDITTDEGKEYIQDMEFSLQFALANRQTMIDRVIQAVEKSVGVPLGSITRSRFINRNHNHAVIDYSNSTVIHRKGATHAEDGMMGVIPGNMKDGSFIVRGKGNTESMASSSHGAGRVLSRRKAKDQLNLEDFHKEMEGIVTNHTDATLDEAPKAYKDIYEVMNLQSDLVDVVDKVTPILNIKG